MGIRQRRMTAELGADWQRKSRASSTSRPPRRRSQVHRGRAHDGTALACKLQYPTCSRRVEADLQQLEWLFAIHRRMNPPIDTTEVAANRRALRETRYQREAKACRALSAMLH